MNALHAATIEIVSTLGPQGRVVVALGITTTILQQTPTLSGRVVISCSAGPVALWPCPMAQ
jgi:hypothetical protein